MTEKDYDKLKQIETAIGQFDSNKLYESSLRLLNAMDYYSTKSVRINPNTFEGFLKSFNITNSIINKEKALAKDWKQVEFIFQISDSDITRVQSFFETEKFDDKEYQSFLFLAIHLKNDNYKRSDLAKITREVNNPFKMPVIVIFYYGNKLTLSIIDRRLHKRDISKDVLEKVTLIKDINILNPQRAHKEILKDLSLTDLYNEFEFHSFTKLHEAWRSTLDISELNKQFYKELTYWYFWALKEVKFPKDELNDNATRNPVNVIRLITRLIFVWFLKEKNLVPDELFNKRELDEILEYKDKTQSTYYKAILQNLFFATLNTEMNKDVKDKNKISRTFVKRNTGVPHYFRYSRYIKDKEKFSNWMDDIPFLNGGLFECLDKRYKDSDKDIFIDGFTQQLKHEDILKVPDYLFFSEKPKSIDLNSIFHTKGKNYEVRGLIDILSHYKFTIEENTPVEEEVALDPELLGKVFENLLASYNEETKSTARKLTGSFYTPREIVNFMVDESLISVFSGKLKEQGITNDIEERLHQLFTYTSETIQFDHIETNILINIIDDCKIIDPACGSGAFPMGILHKLVFILSRLDPNNKKWKQTQLDKAKRDRNRTLEDFEDEINREATLREIDKRIDDIEKAFNINNHELDFARKLYLIENCIYGVDKQPIAIQIAKLRFFIALIVDQKVGKAENEYNRGIKPLPNLETKFVAANSLKFIERPEQLTIVNLHLEESIKNKEEEIHKVREKHFRARTPDAKEKYRILDTQLRGELAILLEQEGLPKDTTKKLADWNPYDQNKWADFFDPMWMFQNEMGFDLVIGNPPYLRVQGLDKVDKKYYEANYISATGSYDLYCLFTERGFNLLNSSGLLNYIVPDKWVNGSLGKGLRFVTRNYIRKLISFKEHQVFNASTYSSLLWIKKTSQQYFEYCELDRDLPNNIELQVWLDHLVSKSFTKFYNSDLGEDAWIFSNKRTMEVLKLLRIQPQTINNIFERIFQGIATSRDEVYFLHNCKKQNGFIYGKSEALDKFVSIEEGLMRPILKGEYVHRYQELETDTFVLFPYQKIESYDSGLVVILKPDYIKKEYPKGWKYLKDCEDLIKSREKGKSSKDKEWYRYLYPKNLTLYDRPKLISPYLSNEGQFTIDENGSFYTNTKCYGFIKKNNTNYSYHLMLGILNSKLLWFYIKNVSSVYRGGYYVVAPIYIKNFPVPNIDQITSMVLEKLVKCVLLYRSKYHKFNNRENDSDIIPKYLENVIDGCIYELYFGEDMRINNVDILSTVTSDIENLTDKTLEEVSTVLFDKWQEPKSEVRNRLLLMGTRCPGTIGVIEEGLKK